MTKSIESKNLVSKDIDAITKYKIRRTRVSLRNATTKKFVIKGFEFKESISQEGESVVITTLFTDTGGYFTSSQVVYRDALELIELFPNEIINNGIPVNLIEFSSKNGRKGLSIEAFVD